MAAQVLNLNNIEQGATWEQVITLSPVVNLTGFAGKCEIRASASIESRIVAAPTVTIDANPLLGKFTLSLTAAQTATIPCTTFTAYNTLTRYQYDVIITSGTNVIRVLNGNVSVSPQITRS